MHILWLGVGAFLGLLLIGTIYEQRCRHNDTKRFPPLGQLIDVGGHRLHVWTKGTEGPTVVIEQGAGSPSIAWLGLQEKISEFARACLYDRAGYPWSDPIPGGRSIEDRVRDLYTLLGKAGIPGPYVLVAHSYGGFLVRLFTRDHPADVVGLVLIDTPDAGAYFRPAVLSRYSQFRRLLVAMKILSMIGLPRLLNRVMAKPDPKVPSEVSGRLNAGMARREYFAAASDDIASLERASPWLSKPDALGSLGELPVVVLTHGQPFPGPFAVLEEGWHEGQERLAALSINSDLITVPKANHMIHHDAPEIVIDAIRRVVNAVRTSQPLNPVIPNRQ